MASLVDKLWEHRTPNVSAARGPAELAVAAREERIKLADKVEKEMGPFAPAYLEALVEVPRERYVRPADIVRSGLDVPLPIDDAGLATISAPHAYLLSFRLVDLCVGDRLVELGSGTGYGAALAARIVGPEGHVLTVEIDGDLASRTRELLPPDAPIECLHGDAMAAAPWPASGAKIICTFAIGALPEPWLAALPEGGVLVAPVGPSESEQKLVRVTRHDGALLVTAHGAVRYVRNRSAHSA